MLRLFQKKCEKNKQQQIKKSIDKLFEDLLSFNEAEAKENFEKDFIEKTKESDNLKRINEIREKMKRDTTT